VEGYDVYLNEKIYKGVLAEILSLKEKQPYFAYFHLFSPHSPYKPGGKFSRLFRNDGFSIPSKQVVPQFASLYRESDESLLRKRTAYDRQIAQVDSEFGKLIDALDTSGVLEDSYLIATSDHGEMFERGFSGHGGRLMYEPVLRTPLLIHAPEQAERKDVSITTSNVDVLPTLLSIAGKDIPPALEGQVLAGFGGAENRERPVFSVAAWQNSAFLPLTKAAFAMHKGAYKLIAYLGYGGDDGIYELYDIEKDPEELHELSKEEISVFAGMKDEFLAHLADANRPFEQNK
jgi:arylsulfatase A-like enzyme